MKKNPQEIVFSLSNQLKGLERGESITLRKVNELTGHHYVTLKSYVEMINYAQTIMPIISLTKDKKGDLIVLVQKKPMLQFDEKDQLLLFLLDHNGYREANAIEIPNQLRPILTQLETEVNTLQSRAYLTKQGLLAAVEVSERREDELIEPIGRQFTESEFTIQEDAVGLESERTVMSEPYRRQEKMILEKLLLKKDPCKKMIRQTPVGAA